MIVDPSSMELVSAVEEMIESVPSRDGGQRQARAAPVGARDRDRRVPQRGGGGRPARGPAPPGARDRRGQGPHDRLRRQRIRSRSWEDQRIVERERYREIVDALGFVVRQELLFGLHVHVGIDDADKAIHVANGMRVHLPILLALSTNSPFWRGQATSWMSSRTPLFRLLPRVGIPPRFEGWDGVLRAHRVHGRGRRGPGLHVPVVGRAPAPQPGDGRGALVRRPDPARAHDRDHGADPGDGEGAVRALRGGRGARAPSPPSCWRRTSGWRRATACTAS